MGDRINSIRCTMLAQRLRALASARQVATRVTQQRRFRRKGPRVIFIVTTCGMVTDIVRVGRATKPKLSV
jgi:hypothetical protein